MASSLRNLFLSNYRNLVLILGFIAPFSAKADIILQEQFSTGALPAGWTNNAIQGSDLWTFPLVPIMGSGSGGNYAVFDDAALGAAVTPNEASLNTYNFDCTGRTAVYMNYRHHWYGVESTYGYVEISNDGGATWVTLITYEKLTRGSFAAPQDTTFDITAYAANQANVQMRFRYFDNSQAGFYWAIDDVTVYAGPDAGVTGLSTPTYLGCSPGNYTSTENITIEITNHGFNSLTNVPVTCDITGVITQTLTGTVPGPIAPGASVSYTFSTTVDMTTEGIYNFDIYSTLGIDAYNANNAFNTALHQTVTLYPYTADFNGTTAGWFSTGNAPPLNGNRNFVHGVLPYLNGPDGQGDSWYIEATGNNGTQVWVESPVFDFSNVTNPTLSLDIKRDLIYCWARLQTSIDGGATWQNLSSPDTGFYDDGAYWRRNPTTLPILDTWETRSTKLCDLSGEPCVKFRILAYPYYGETSQRYQFAFDNFSIHSLEQDDIEAVELILPKRTCSSYGTTETVGIIVKNNTCRPLYNVPISIQMNGGTVINEIIPGPVPRFGAYIYTFTATFDMSAAGTYTFSSTLNLATDGDNTNDNEVASAINDPIATFPYIADFNGDNDYWSTASTTDTRYFRREPLPYLNGPDGQGDSWYIEARGNNGTQIWVESPVFDFSSVTNPKLSLDIKRDLIYCWSRIQYSTNGGTSWQNLSSVDPGFYDDGSYWRRNPTTLPIIDEWENRSTSLCDLIGEPCVKFRIIAYPYYGETSQRYQFAFDNFAVFDSPDVAVAAFIDPVDIGCLYSTTQNVTIRVYNNSCGPVSNIPVTCEITGPVTTTFTGTIAGPVAANGYEDFTFGSNFDMTAIGTYTLTGYSALPGDSYLLNDTLTQDYVVDQVQISTFPFIEDFNSGTAFWMASGNAPPLNGNRNFVHGVLPYLNGPDGQGDSWYIEATGNNGTQVWVESPVFDFSNVTNPTLSLDIKRDLIYCWARLQTSIDGGATWQNLSSPDAGFYDDGTYWRRNPTSLPIIDAWETRSTKLCDLSGEPCVKFRILAYPYYGETSPRYQFAFDNFSIHSLEQDDIEAVELILPKRTCSSYGTAETVGIIVKNNTCRPLYNVPISIQMNGGTVINEIIPGPVPRFGAYIYTFSATFDMSAAGTYTFSSTLNLATDGDNTNDNEVASAINDPIATFPYIADFNGDNNYWSTASTTNTRYFRREPLPYLNGPDGQGDSWYIEARGNNGTQIWVESPVFDFSSVTNPKLSLDIKRDLIYCWSRIQYSTNGGISWQNLSSTDPGFYDDGSYWRRNPTTLPIIDQWENRSTSLCDLIGEPCVKFRIIAYPYYGETSQRYQFAFDNFAIFDGPDISVTAFIDPFDDGCLYSTTQNVTIRVYNNSCGPVSNIPVTCEITGPATTTFTGTVPGPIASGGYVDYTFGSTFDMTGIGTFDLTAYSSMPGDSYLLNDTISESFLVDQIEINTYPYLEDFDAGTGFWIPNGNAPPLNGNRNFVHGALPYLNGPDGQGDSWYIEATGNNGTQIWVESPVFDFSSVTNPKLSMDIKRDLIYCWARLQTSVDGGSSWQNLPSPDPGFYDDGTYWRRNPTSLPIINVWENRSTSLCHLIGESCVKFRVLAYPYYGETSQRYQFAFDNFRIFDGPDVAVTAFIDPVDDGCLYSATQNVTIRVYNNSCGDVTNVPVSCEISGVLNTTLTGTVLGPIPFNDYVDYTFATSVDMTPVGAYNMTAYSEMPGDAYLTNDTSYVTFNVNQIEISSFPYYENFNGSSGYWIPSGNAPPLNGNRNFAHGTLPYLNGPQGYGDSWYIEATGNNGAQVWVESPVFDFSGVTNPKISLDIKRDLQYCWARLQYSINGGSSWQNIASPDAGFYDDGTYWRRNPATLPIIDEWENRTTTLCFLAGESCVKFRIIAYPYYGETSQRYQFAFDNFHVTDTPIDAALLAVDGCYGSEYYLDVIVLNNDKLCLTSPTITSLDLTYSIDGGAPVTQTFTGLNIPFGGTETISIPNVTIPGTSSSVQVWCSLPNGLNDHIIINDTVWSTTTNWQNCNDYCSNATQIGLGTTTLSQTSNATITPSVEPLFPCGGGATLENTVWYYFTTDSLGGEVTLSILNTVCSPSSNGIQVSINEISGLPCDPANYTNVYCANNGNTNDIVWGPVFLPPNTDYYITIDGYAGNDCEFDIQLEGAITSLPVELHSFTTVCKEEFVELRWTTVSEYNNDHFRVLRSTDGINYNELGIVDGQGNTTSLTHYIFRDNSPYNGIAYYRLEQADMDGLSTQVGTKAVDCVFDTDWVKLYPNPSNGNSELTIHTSNKEEVIIVLTDNMGKILRSERINPDLENTYYTIERGPLEDGVYHVMVTIGANTFSKKWVIID